MARVAKAAGMTRERLHRVLQPSGNLRLSTVLAILKAAGLRLAVKRAPKT